MQIFVQKNGFDGGRGDKSELQIESTAIILCYITFAPNFARIVQEDMQYDGSMK